MSDYVKSEIISWIKTFASALVMAFIITRFVLVNAAVPTGSMENTIMPGDRIVASRLSYLMSEPERFDVVVFKYPDNEKLLYIKRVIGLPGETVEVIDGSVFINDQLIDDTMYVKEQPYGSWGPYQVPDGHYFMMGDNRNSSEDSRKWDNTYLSKNKMLGKAIFKYFRGFELIK